MENGFEGYTIFQNEIYGGDLGEMIDFQITLPLIFQTEFIRASYVWRERLICLTSPDPQKAAACGKRHASADQWASKANKNSLAKIYLLVSPPIPKCRSRTLQENTEVSILKIAARRVARCEPLHQTSAEAVVADARRSAGALVEALVPALSL